MYFFFSLSWTKKNINRLIIFFCSEQQLYKLLSGTKNSKKCNEYIKKKMEYTIKRKFKKKKSTTLKKEI